MVITLKKLLTNYFDYTKNQNEHYKLSSVFSKNGKIIFNPENSGDLQLIFEINKDSYADRHYASTALQLNDGSKFTINRIELENFNSTSVKIAMPFSIDDVIISNRAYYSPIEIKHNVIIDFQEKALTYLFGNGAIVGGTYNKPLSYKELKSIFKILFFDDWVEPKLILRSEINTEKFETTSYKHSYNGNDEFVGNSINLAQNKIDSLIEHLKNLIVDPYNNKKLKQEKVLEVREILFWTLESLISEDVLGFSSDVNTDLNEETNPIYSGIYLSKFLYMMDSSRKTDYLKASLEELIEEGSLNETSSPTLFYIAKKVIPEN
jgi:hypothetical protein